MSNDVEVSNDVDQILVALVAIWKGGWAKSAALESNLRLGVTAHEFRMI